MDFEINGLKWKLLDVDANSERLKVDGKDCFGVTRYRSLEICIDREQPKELYRQVLIHEIVHAFTFSFGVHLVANEETEESVCDFAGAHFDEIMKTVNLAFDFHMEER